MERTEVEQCEFAYRCPRTWDALYPTNIDTVRYCDACQRNVFLSQSAGEALGHAAQGRCVAIPIQVTGVPAPVHMVGDLKVPSEQELDRWPLREKYSGERGRWLGLDGCPAGWFFVGIDDEHHFSFGVLGHIEEIDERLESAELILIDIPVGLLDGGGPGRECETLARKALGRRAPSVFSVPSRAAVSMPTYRSACDENHRRLGRKLSRQTWAIAPKIREVDEFLREHRPGKLREMHPEVAFWALNGRQAMRHNKKTPEGHDERIAVLERYYPRAAECFELARQAFIKRDVASDDIVDALVGAVTAMQSPRLATFPESPPLDDQGLAMEMVFADF